MIVIMFDNLIAQIIDYKTTCQLVYEMMKN